MSHEGHVRAARASRYTMLRVTLFESASQFNTRVHFKPVNYCWCTADSLGGWNVPKPFPGAPPCEPEILLSAFLDEAPDHFRLF